MYEENNYENEQEKTDEVPVPETDAQTSQNSNMNPETGAQEKAPKQEQTYYSAAGNMNSQNGSQEKAPEQEQTYYSAAGNFGANGQNNSFGKDRYNQNGSQDSSKKKGNGFAKPIIAIAVVLCISLAAAAGFIWMSRGGQDAAFLESETGDSLADNSSEASTYNQTKVYESSDGISVTDVSDIVEQNMPSVVAITTTTEIERGGQFDIYDFYFGGGSSDSRTYQQESAGSGIIIKQTDDELLIVTNNHVVESADNLKVLFDGLESKEAVDGQIKGTNATSDVAVVSVKLSDIPKNANIKVATLGNSDSVKVGNGVIAIGNALGYGQSVTTGIISAKDRSVELDNGSMTLLQTDAAINGGNSGGALLNANGEVIGINVAKYSSSGSYASASIEGMGFAIPISSVTDTINNLENMKTRQKVDEEKRGYLGINGSDVDEEDALFYNIPQGVIITSVGKDSPAAKAGIEEKDIITSFDGQEIKSMSELQKKLEYYAANEKVKVVISKNTGNGYQSKEVIVTLGNESVLSND